jgi:flagellar hook-length control protein FliK
MGQSQAALQAGPMGGADGAAGSSGPVDTVSGAGSSPMQVATGGFAQPALTASNVATSQAHSAAAQSTPADQVAVEIQKAVSAGKDHVRVRLHPAELGQIDISLKVRHDGTIRAIVTTDRPDTFDLLQRDLRGLERALQDAGLKTDSGSLSFNLRGGENNGTNGGQRDTGGTAQADTNSNRTVNPPPADLDVPIPVVSSHALDIRV